MNKEWVKKFLYSFICFSGNTVELMKSQMETHCQKTEAQGVLSDTQCYRPISIITLSLLLPLQDQSAHDYLEGSETQNNMQRSAICKVKSTP